MGKRRKKNKKKNPPSQQETIDDDDDDQSHSSQKNEENMTQMKRRFKFEIRNFNNETRILVKRAGKEGKERKREVQRERIEQKQLLEESHEQQLNNNKKKKKEEDLEEDTNKSPMSNFFSSQDELEEEKRKKRREKMRLKREKKNEIERLHREKIKQNELKILEKGGTKGQLEFKEIQKRLKESGNRTVFSIPADGNCLYSSICHQLKTRHGDINKNVLDIRRICAFHLRKNEKEYKGFITGGNFEEYCHKIETTNEWGGHLEIRVISEAMDLIIHIHKEKRSMTVGKNEEVEEQGEQEEEEEEEEEEVEKKIIKKKREIHLSFHKFLYTTGKHYNSVIDL